MLDEQQIEVIILTTNRDAAQSLAALAARLDASPRWARVYVGRDGVRIAADPDTSSTPSDSSVPPSSTLRAAFSIPAGELPGDLTVEGICSGDPSTCSDVTLRLIP